jgi:hypothetical protein
MNEDQLHEWSRHYDNIQWVVTGVLSAAVGGLLVTVYASFLRELCILGLVICVIAVFFSASFRALRRRIHLALPESHRPFLRSRPLLRQWPVNVGVFVIASAMFSWKLYAHAKSHGLVWLVIWIAAVAAMLLFYRASERD